MANTVNKRSSVVFTGFLTPIFLGMCQTQDKGIIKAYRMSEKDFIRERKLPFWRVLVLILSGWKKSLQNRVNKFFEELDKLEESSCQ